LTLFYSDLKADTLPQWMFITPNMTSDGHDTSVTTAGSWTRNFIEPLLNDKTFMKDTLVLITFDENHTYTIPNNVFTILLGDAIPHKLKGTTDTNFYDHYSSISTVEANWDLNTLGRWDVGANVFKFVADKTGDTVRTWTTPDFSTVFLNASYPGFLNKKNATAMEVPNTLLKYAGRAVSKNIARVWTYRMAYSSYYTSDLEIPDAQHLPKGY